MPQSINQSVATQNRSTATVSPAVPRVASAVSTNSNRTISLFGLEIADTTLVSAANWLVSCAQSQTRTVANFVNADCVNVMHRNPAYADALMKSDRIFADGIGVRLAARLNGYRLCDNVNGTDLFPVLSAHASNAGTGLYLFGAKPGRAEAAGKAMHHAHPRLIISGSHHGYIDGLKTEDAVIDDINQSGAEILLVALGAPMQELWIARNRHRLSPSVIIGVGGLFDYYSGSMPRAPLAIRRISLEWAWRLALEPRRLARRYLLGNAEFLIRVGLQRARSGT